MHAHRIRIFFSLHHPVNNTRVLAVVLCWWVLQLQPAYMLPDNEMLREIQPAYMLPDNEMLRELQPAYMLPDN